MTLPLVSIAIPAYNHAAFIEACLASVCAQTYPELELVLIDDGSSDETFEVAKRYLEPRRGRFRRIVLERRENQGVSANSNACIEACQGEWVHLLGSDDVLYPNKVASIQEAIDFWGRADLMLVHADADLINPSGVLVVKNRRKQKERPQPGPDTAAYRWLFHHNKIANPTIALRRDAFLSIGGFDRALPLEDLDCWLRISARGAIARIPKVLASCRTHPGNTIRQRARMLGAALCSYAKFIEGHPGLLPDQEIKQHFRRNVRRFWNRIWRAQPWQFPLVLGAMLRSYLVVPRPEDYRRFGNILLKAKRTNATEVQDIEKAS